MLIFVFHLWKRRGKGGGGGGDFANNNNYYIMEINPLMTLIFSQIKQW